MHTSFSVLNLRRFRMAYSYAFNIQLPTPLFTLQTIKNLLYKQSRISTNRELDYSMCGYLSVFQIFNQKKTIKT